MEVFRREGTRKMPDVSFDAGSGVFEIKGRSYDEEVVELYEDILLWLDKYIEVPLSSTKLKFKTDYFSTSSYKYFVQIIKKIEQILDKNHTVKIIWYYEKDDEEIMESGENLKEITSIPVEVKELKSLVK